MPLEIERKFLIEGPWPQPCSGAVAIVQGYLPQPDGEAGEVRVRMARNPDGTEQAWLTHKSQGGLVRTEVEEEIPVERARQLLSQATSSLEKLRYTLALPHGLELEVDVYEGSLAGLVVAEVELPSPDTPLALPEWVGQEVTEEPGYKNKSLAQDGLPRPPALPAKPGVRHGR